MITSVSHERKVKFCLVYIGRPYETQPRVPTAEEQSTRQLLSIPLITHPGSLQPSLFGMVEEVSSILSYNYKYTIDRPTNPDTWIWYSDWFELDGNLAPFGKAPKLLIDCMPSWIVIGQLRLLHDGNITYQSPDRLFNATRLLFCLEPRLAFILSCDWTVKFFIHFNSCRSTDRDGFMCRTWPENLSKEDQKEAICDF